MDLERENRKLRQQLLDLSQEAQRSQATLERFHARELELMSADTLAELLHVMTEGLLASFNVDALQLLLVDPEHEIRHLLSSNGINDAAYANLRFVDELDSINPRYTRLHSPWLGPFLHPEYNLLFDYPQGLESIAILPVYCRNRLVGASTWAAGIANVSPASMPPTFSPAWARSPASAWRTPSTGNGC